MEPRTLTDAEVRRRVAAGERVDLAGKNLEGADLADADLVGARLTGAELWKTRLRGARIARDELRELEPHLGATQRAELVVYGEAELAAPPQPAGPS